ncbi:hypothetical protein [Geomonas anaerohicana]|uniref:Uncharacterized protein n=1 Tax=Geomonas anaerohicana TaxID=2798583 RepID=A0ABS0YDQ9_9BACT|nr:hypothetical protein [Geomonas anaerohicana]MBJ6750444.1 hypothetical protein [Geomonas anaerohicana]
MACNKEGHSEHICALTAKGEIDKVHQLTLHPTVECGNCGAKAKDIDAVCDPIQLPEAGWLGD